MSLTPRKTPAPKESAITSVRLPMDLHEQLAEAAAAESVKPSQVMRYALALHLRAHGYADFVWTPFQDDED